MAWTRPRILDVSIRCEEDVLQACWAPSEPAPIQGECPFANLDPCPMFNGVFD